jgi:hypothetical protein
MLACSANVDMGQAHLSAMASLGQDSSVRETGGEVKGRAQGGKG